MRQTTNLGLALYDTTDKMNITGAENSLNHNMELIDTEIAKTMKTPETGETGQVLTKTETGFEWQNAPTGESSGDGTQNTTSSDAEAFMDKNDLRKASSQNVLKGNYTLDDFTKYAIIGSSGDVFVNTENDSYRGYIVSPLIQIEGGHTFGILTSNGVGLSPGCLASVNDGYGLFAADGTTVVSKVSFKDIGNKIVLIETPSTAKYIRFCIKCNTAITEEDTDNYRRYAVNAFNRWIMGKDATEDITVADFEEYLNPNSNISILYRADGSTLKIMDESAHVRIDELKTKTDKFDIVQTGGDGQQNVLQVPYAETDFVNYAIILSGGSIRNDGTAADASYCVSPLIPVIEGTTYAFRTKVREYQISLIPVETNMYGFFASDGITSVSRNGITTLSDGITLLFTVPTGASYVRFTMSNNSDLSSVVDAFNNLIMIANADENVTDDDFVLGDPLRNVLQGENLVMGEETVPLKALTPDVSGIVGKLHGKIIVNFGDSIFGNSRPPRDISTLIAKLTGATVYNCAFGGCRMGPHSGHWDAFSMYRLADAIASGDWSVQDEAMQYDDRTSYAEYPLANLKSIDWNKVYAITIGYCTNDFSGNNALDNSENPKDTTTFGGSARYSIERILSTYPNINIYILSATWRWYMDDSNAYVTDSDSKTNTLGIKLTDYNSKLNEIADEYHLKYVDNYNIGINKINYSHYFPETDGTHHNENGRERIASNTVHDMF